MSLEIYNSNDIKATSKEALDITTDRLNQDLK